MNTKNKEKKRKTFSVKQAVKLAVGFAVLCAVIVLTAVIYVNSGYRTAIGTFDYRLTFNTRKYEFITSQKSIDMYQIKDLSSAECDCYVYVGKYDPNQDLNETLAIVNQTDGTNLAFMNTTVGSEDYPAIYVAYETDEGGYAYMYYIDYQGYNFVISTLSDKAHQREVDKMLSTFTIGK